MLNKARRAFGGKKAVTVILLRLLNFNLLYYVRIYFKYFDRNPSIVA